MHSPHIAHISAGSPELLRKLAGVQDELLELAFRLDQQGRMDAADVAVTTAARLGELCAELDLRVDLELSPTRGAMGRI